VTSSRPRPSQFARLTCSSPYAFGMAVLRLFLAGLFLAWMVAAAASPPAGKKPQKPYALIFGTVWGPDDRPIYGVKVKIRQEGDKKARWELYSDHMGEFAQRVPAGKQDYVIWAEPKGYKFLDGRQLQVEEVKVHVENDERVDTGLHLK
jgi:hypothetical protein